MGVYFAGGDLRKGGAKMGTRVTSFAHTRQEESGALTMGAMEIFGQGGDSKKRRAWTVGGQARRRNLCQEKNTSPRSICQVYAF